MCRPRDGVLAAELIPGRGCGDIAIQAKEGEADDGEVRTLTTAHSAVHPTHAFVRRARTMA